MAEPKTKNPDLNLGHFINGKHYNILPEGYKPIAEVNLGREANRRHKYLITGDVKYLDE